MTIEISKRLLTDAGPLWKLFSFFLAATITFITLRDSVLAFVDFSADPWFNQETLLSTSSYLGVGGVHHFSNLSYERVEMNGRIFEVTCTTSSSCAGVDLLMDSGFFYLWRGRADAKKCYDCLAKVYKMRDHGSLLNNLMVYYLLILLLIYIAVYPISSWNMKAKIIFHKLLCGIGQDRIIEFCNPWDKKMRFRHAGSSFTIAGDADNLDCPEMDHFHFNEGYLRVDGLIMKAYVKNCYEKIGLLTAEKASNVKKYIFLLNLDLGESICDEGGSHYLSLEENIEILFDESKYVCKKTGEGETYICGKTGLLKLLSAQNPKYKKSFLVMLIEHLFEFFSADPLVPEGALLSAVSRKTAWHNRPEGVGNSAWRKYVSDFQHLLKTVNKSQERLVFVENPSKMSPACEKVLHYSEEDLKRIIDKQYNEDRIFEFFVTEDMEDGLESKDEPPPPCSVKEEVEVSKAKMLNVFVTSKVDKATLSQRDSLVKLAKGSDVLVIPKEGAPELVEAAQKELGINTTITEGEAAGIFKSYAENWPRLDKAVKENPGDKATILKTYKEVLEIEEEIKKKVMSFNYEAEYVLRSYLFYRKEKERQESILTFGRRKRSRILGHALKVTERFKRHLSNSLFISNAYQIFEDYSAKEIDEMLRLSMTQVVMGKNPPGNTAPEIADQGIKEEREVKVIRMNLEDLYTNPKSYLSNSKQKHRRMNKKRERRLIMGKRLKPSILTNANMEIGVRKFCDKVNRSNGGFQFENMRIISVNAPPLHCKKEVEEKWENLSCRKRDVYTLLHKVRAKANFTGRDKEKKKNAAQPKMSLELFEMEIESRIHSLDPVPYLNMHLRHQQMEGQSGSCATQKS